MFSWFSKSQENIQSHRTNNCNTHCKEPGEKGVMEGVLKCEFPPQPSEEERSHRAWFTPTGSLSQVFWVQEGNGGLAAVAQVEMRKATASLPSSLHASSGAWTFICSQILPCPGDPWAPLGRGFLAPSHPVWKADIFNTRLCGEAAGRREGRGLCTAHWANSTWITCCFCLTLPHGRLFSDRNLSLQEIVSRKQHN